MESKTGPVGGSGVGGAVSGPISQGVAPRRTASRPDCYRWCYRSGRCAGTQAKAETKTGGTWSSPTGVSTVAKVDYAYYVAADTDGELGDLKLVTKTIPQTDSGIDIVKNTHYRYYEGTYNASTNPGYPHQIRLVVDDEGCRNFDYADYTFDNDFLSATVATLEPYAAAYFEYEATTYRISEAWFHGACGCSGGGTGTYTYTYGTNGSYTDNTGYDATWATRTVAKRPDNSYRTVYFDEANQALHSVVTAGDPAGTSPAPSKWVTAVTRNSDGCVTEISTPANVTGYTHSTGAVTTSTSAGLVHAYTRDASGADKNFVTDKKWKTGTSGTAYLDGTWAYDTTTATKTVGDDAVVRVFLDSSREYTQAITSGTTGSNLWDYATTVHSGTLAVKDVTTTQPAVSTGNNGSNASVTSSKYFNGDGTLAFEKDGDGTITYHAYAGGQKRLVVQDADTTKTGTGETFEGVTIPTGFASSGSAIHWKTTTSHDPQGRVDGVTANDGTIQKNYYSRLKDHRQVALQAPKFVAGTPTIYGPVSYTVSNHAGQTEVSATVALSGGTSTAALTAYIDETDADPITAMDLGTVARLSTNIMDESGTHVETSRAYFSIPASGVGTDGTHYDATTYGYDDSGRVVRTKAPHGTINRTVYDSIGRKSESWIGLNDADEAGTDDMVKTDSVVYDGGSDGGNSLVTTSTAFVQDSTTDQRVTSYTYDVRGNTLLATNALAPHTFTKYDNLGRAVASAQYTSTASIDVAADDPTTEATNRVALSQSFYDERGNVRKSQRHKIDPADGSDDDNLQSLTWYDADGRAVKQDGSQLSKTAYDRLGRVTDTYVLASDNDSAYADADDVTGDIVVEQRSSVIEGSTGNVVMDYSISRNFDDVGGSPTTGALDTQADNDRFQITAANVKGRVSITGHWYDTLNRRIDSVGLGTYNAADYDRDGASAPTRSDTAIRSTTTYNDDGTAQKVEDPKSIVTKWEYDALGRKTKEIRNYNAAVNSGNPSGTDDNVTTTWTYVDGLMTALTADVPSGETDQVTTYTYGTTKGASAGDSKIGTGHLLKKVAYPDSTGDSDTVKYAYDAQGAQIYKLDQAGNVMETSYDTLGRAIHQRWTTAAGGFDTAVRRISSTYGSDGDLELVTQYDNATVGSGTIVDEVKYVQDGWGNLTDFQYDRDSAVGASPDNKYSMSYAYAKATGGRNTVRRTQWTLPSGTALDFDYSSTSSYDADLSRVTKLKIGATAIAEYQYNGAGQVVGTIYDEPDVFSKLHTGTSSSYDAIDRFGKPIISRWTKDLATDRNFYETVITWDRNGNPTAIKDNVHTGFDVKYDIDDIDRVARADEGTLSGGSITSRTRDQQWTLTHTGNWSREKLDLNGDGDFVDTDEHDDTRTHNAVNELTARDTDSNSSNNYSLTYDALGNLTDDAEDYEYVYDGWGRMRFIKKTSDSSTVAEYKYNGLGFRTAAHEDTDADTDVDGSDKWYYLVHDEQWRHVSTFRESDTSPKEEFVPHHAGRDGRGGSSYIDLVACRNRDDSTAWTSASDGTLETRIYYCQSWRADVSAIVTSGGVMVEWVKYSAYGVPFGLPRGDTNSDGDADATDRAAVSGWSTGYDVRYDPNLDGTIDGTDASMATNADLARDAMSLVENERSFGGYSGCSPLGRYRFMDCDLGRWISRDPLVSFDVGREAEVLGRSRANGTIDERTWLNQYEHTLGNPLGESDPYGLYALFCINCLYMYENNSLSKKAGLEPFECDYHCQATFDNCYGWDCYNCPSCHHDPYLFKPAQELNANDLARPVLVVVCAALGLGSECKNFLAGLKVYFCEPIAWVSKSCPAKKTTKW
jgi:YD repeat-containing protein